MNSDGEKKQSSDLLSYFSTRQWIIFVLASAIGLALRWFDLADKPFHHDESQHAMFGKYFYDFPEHQYYRYNPMLHGPLLYNFLRLVYNFFDSTFFAARASTAFLGSLFIFLPLIFRSFFSPRACLALIVGIAFSPSLVYWSRFLIHDYFVVTSLLIALVGVTLVSDRYKPFFFLIGFTLQYCIKANVFVTIAILLGFIIYEALFKWVVFRERSSQISGILIHAGLIVAGLLGALVFHGYFPENWGGAYLLVALPVISLVVYMNKTLLWRYPVETFIGVAISTFIFCYLYSSGFRYSGGILGGLYKECLPYWLHHHTIERIKGPFMIHFYMFCWYELVFLLAMFGQVIILYKSLGQFGRFFSLSLLFVAFLAAAITNASGVLIEDITIWKTFKLKDNIDVIGFILLIANGLIVTSAHLAKRERVLAFTGYFFTASFFTYSYLGEKVPWLSIYPLTAGFVYLTLFYDSYLPRLSIYKSFSNFCFGQICRYLGLIFLTLAVLFVAENILSLSVIFSGRFFEVTLNLFRASGFKTFIADLYSGSQQNLLFFGYGFVFYGLYQINRIYPFLPKINLEPFLLILLSIISIRTAIQVNYVYAGSETEFISQVHTTREFDNIMQAIRRESLENLSSKPIKILGEGDSVWPMTWYMVGIPEYRFTANPNERKEFDYLLSSYSDQANPPEGFSARRITLRGWWVPDYGQMTLKRFLNFAINRRPWNGSGFTYLWFYSKR
ncbi:MAG TPA: TIGR03663 family protein [Oligoflexia bacterium]|nr:TIGR03663 family protein [Oligoflexia bacterium]HMP26824.1 TIGR03663 family protein [Oligoflexia bacterium]